MDYALLFLRLLVGGLFIMHGWDKYNAVAANSMEAWFINVKLPLPGLLVRVVRTWELLGGLLLITGYAEWAGPAILIVIMIGAIALAHRQLDPRATNGGWEYPAVLIAINILFLLGGFGAYTL